MTLVQFENLGFVIMSTRENIRLIARCPLLLRECYTYMYISERRRNVAFSRVFFFEDAKFRENKILTKSFKFTINFQPVTNSIFEYGTLKPRSYAQNTPWCKYTPGCKFAPGCILVI